jgi:hypothetical protein
VENGGGNSFSMTVHWYNSNCHDGGIMGNCSQSISADEFNTSEWHYYTVEWTATAVELWVDSATNTSPLLTIEDGGTQGVVNGVAHCGTSDSGGSCVPSDALRFNFQQSDLSLTSGEPPSPSSEPTQMAWFLESSDTNYTGWSESYLA